MNQPAIEMATPESYLEHAKVINGIARETLRVDTSRQVSAVAAKVSIGLSLQSAELAGKAMLRALGDTVQQIRLDHRHHDLVGLLEAASNRIAGDARLAAYQDFLAKSPTIDGTVFGTSIGGYFRQHFARGPVAQPRSYFYPDEPAFAGPVPIQAVLVMVDDLLGVTEQVIRTCAERPR